MKISAIILNKNEEEAIRDSLESIRQLAEEIIIVDGGSTDKSLEIAREFGAKIVPQKGKDYASWRNQGRDEAQNDWLLYLDPDERITPLLKEEIRIQFFQKKPKISAFAIPRRNFLLGRELKHGGWYPDYQVRLLEKKKLKKWVGELHERPEFEGSLTHLKNPMIHLQPDRLEPALTKSIWWSDFEAKLLSSSDHPQASWWRILRMGATTLFDRLLKKRGFLDGVEGFIEGVYQSFHTMIVYIKLWELQNKK